MTSVLVITDNERVQRAFASLESDGGVQVRTAGTLSEGDEEISAAVPDSVFLQSRISGFSGEIVVRHLKKTLPSTTKVTLLAVDPDDAAQAKKHRIPVVELWADDEGLKDQLSAAVARRKGAKGRVADRRRTRREPAEASVQVPVPPVPAETMAQPAPEAPVECSGVTRPGPAEVPAPAGGEAAATTEEPAATGEQVAGTTEEPAATGEEAAATTEESAATGEEAAATAAEGAIAGGLARDEATARKRRPAKRPAEEELFTEATEAPVEQETESGTETEAVEDEDSEPEATTFAELMRRAAAKRASAPAPEGEEQVQPGTTPPPTGEQVPPGVPPSRAEAPMAPPLPEVEDRVRFGGAEGKGRPVEPQPAPPEEPKAEPKRPAVAKEEREQLYSGFTLAEPLEEAMARARKKKHPHWVFPLAVALLIVPLVYYVLTAREERPTVPERAKKPPVATPAPVPPPGGAPAGPAIAPSRAQTPAKGTAAPAQAPAARPTSAPASKGPAVAQGRSPAQAPAPAASRQPAPQGAKPAQPPVLAPGQKGLKTIPPFMAGATLDPSYGKGHPGWVRYLGARAQYRLFREGGTFRALQVIPVGGQSIPDQLYQRALLEFGGIDSYQIQSSDTKGKYLVEQGIAKGGVAVTLYRDKKDLSLRGLVVYYR